MSSDVDGIEGLEPADMELWEQIQGAGEVSETLMRFVGGHGITSPTVTRELIYAVAQLERQLGDIKVQLDKLSARPY